MTAAASHRRETILDLRPPFSHAHDRPRGAVSLTLEDLAERAYLLPPRTRPLVVIAATPDQARSAAALLQRAERTVRTFVEPDWRGVFEVEKGPPSNTAAWEPSPLLRRFVSGCVDEVPGRRVLDIACGTGRNAVYLAQHGFDVTGLDRLADALERAQDLAARSGVTIRAVQCDLEEPGALAGWQTAGHEVDCVVVVRYLDRSLFPSLVRCLVPGGVLVYETFTVEQQRMGHPRNPAFLLQPGELVAAFPTLEILFHEEDWHDGAHTAQFIARRPGP